MPASPVPCSAAPDADPVSSLFFLPALIDAESGGGNTYKEIKLIYQKNDFLHFRSTMSKAEKHSFRYYFTDSSPKSFSQVLFSF